MKCKNCNYEWEYKGKLLYATCPSCQTKNKRNEVIKNENENAD